MKKIIQLGLLAALAGGSAMATTVSFVASGSAPYPNVASVTGGSGTFSPTTSFDSITFTNGGGTITAKGFIWDDTRNDFPTYDAYNFASVRANGTGLGVATVPTNNRVDGLSWEYVLLDFGSTVKATEIVLTYYSAPDPNLNFTYTWLSNPVNVGDQTPAVPLNLYTTAATSTSGAVYTFDISALQAGSDRYLLLGATNHGNPETATRYSITSVTYTSVPDGASTLALMGAALATLGFAARRRKE
jgi:hypothetical protein